MINFTPDTRAKSPALFIPFHLMGTAVPTAEQSNNNPEVFSWLKTLPVAPVYHPTIQEFQDPIAYIFKIEKEASKYGICKIVPPVAPEPKKSAISNLNRSLAARSPNSQPTFTTRQQQIGFCPRKQNPVQKSVWQSGEHYTLEQFVAKAKSFEKSYLKNHAKKPLSALEVETLYWKANGDRPFSVEYANDLPGSAFGPIKENKRRDAGDTAYGNVTVGETAWNMRGISRANGSLLRFMKEEIPGVTSPMVYIAMMFSWFAWHVEDHDLHSLNYMHMGAGKTWYGVPRDAAMAFEEVVRVHGYNEEINPLVTFAMLGEKTTVMSPEVLIKAGVPCCRLVQNAGEFVVTFPRAYHLGFSHGFNCGEASNIATPEWLRFAKDAAIRRASINCPPMVSHFQLLYDLALAICSRMTMSSNLEPRSSRLKDKMKVEGETLVKQLFVQDVMQNNNLLHALGKESTVVLLPQNSSKKFAGSNLRIGSKYKGKYRVPFSLCSSEAAAEASEHIAPNETALVGRRDAKQYKAFYSVRAKFSSVSQKDDLLSPSGGSDACALPFETRYSGAENEGKDVGDECLDRGLFSCVKCGIWPFACVAIVQPTESAARYLLSADCNSFNDWLVCSRVSSDGMIIADDEQNASEPDSSSASLKKNVPDGLYDVPIQSADFEIPMVSQSTYPIMLSDFPMPKEDTTFEMAANVEKPEVSSALGLLAMAYGNPSDSDEDDIPPESPANIDDSISKMAHGKANVKRGHDSRAKRAHGSSFTKVESLDSEDEDSSKRVNLHGAHGSRRIYDKDGEYVTSSDFNEELAVNNLSNTEWHCSSGGHDAEISQIGDGNAAAENVPFACDEDSSRMHVFCLEHAVEVEQRLHPIGGVQISLLCHPDYPKVEAAAKQLAEELEMDYPWKDLSFQVATEDDEERIRSALESEEAMPKKGDWAVKLGINLYYSATLCRSPLYRKQMPYNSIIYSAFSCSSPSDSPLKPHVRGKGGSGGGGRQKKIVVAGKWCGKVWMSNQVHPLLVQRDREEEQEERTFNGWSKGGERITKKQESSHRDENILISRKQGRKRKMKVESRPVRKMKFVETNIAESDDCEDSSADKSHHEEHKRSFRRPKPRVNVRKPKAESRPTEKEKRRDRGIVESDLEDSEDGGSRQDRRGNVRKQQLGQETPQPQGSRKRTTKPEEGKEGGPSTRLRKRIAKPPVDSETKPSSGELSCKNKGKRSVALTGPKMKLPTLKSPTAKGPALRLPAARAPAGKRTPATKGPARHNEAEEGEYFCDIEGCIMSFGSKEELSLHKRNICPVEGCDKKFFSHKYLVQHRRVHEDDRPLKCPWKGCRMSFKWAWARTEHIRVHTGARPYVCNEPGCGQTFRFVSDFSRHKRKTGHSAKKKARG
ncbi:hypothetical protein Nepgr_018587 [Nepenthes gracilis]|uniref:Lysine-specific demethylase REF6 n=1 Tax=Nepenthes gracilis TaxID=150966 RepID=A0AAD3SVE1_NEPGR|nr:hypothetical protein Nepgr_018587 [Nepenthes gracilis]